MPVAALAGGVLAAQVAGEAMSLPGLGAVGAGVLTAYSFDRWRDRSPRRIVLVLLTVIGVLVLSVALWHGAAWLPVVAAALCVLLYPLSSGTGWEKPCF